MIGWQMNTYPQELQKSALFQVLDLMYCTVHLSPCKVYYFPHKKFWQPLKLGTYKKKSFKQFCRKISIFGNPLNPPPPPKRWQNGPTSNHSFFRNCDLCQFFRICHPYLVGEKQCNNHLRQQFPAN